MTAEAGRIGEDPLRFRIVLFYSEGKEMAKTVQDIMNLIRERDIKMVDFKMVDINGQYRHVTILAENFTEDTMKAGIGFDASNYEIGRAHV